MAKRKRLSFDSPVLPRISPGEAAPAPIAGVVGDASANAALTEMSETLEAAREGGRMVMDLPLEQIVLDYLVRDRIVADDGDMQSLQESLRARGQQVPIEVTRLGPDRYGLISGWRRCQALLALKTGTVLALIRPMTEAPDAYRAMVEENEIRVGLSYYERARIVARSVEQGVFASKREALSSLFAAASRAKRSKIGTFLPIVAALDGHLRFPQGLTERSGLALGRALAEDDDLAARAVTVLQSQSPTDAVAEAACLNALLQPAANAPSGPAKRKAAKAGTSQKGAPETLCPGVEMVFSEGKIVLNGARVNARLAERLRGFLAHDKART